MWAFDLTFGLGLALAAYVLLTPARRRWTVLLGGLALASPGLRWVTAVFGFPIRLQLSAWVVAILQALGADATANGNLIRLNGVDFAVDPACMGLQMTGLSALTGLFLIIHLENRTRTYLSFGWLTGVAGGVGMLLILTNLLRILALVIFRIAPENPLHDAIGIACLVVYLLIPLTWGLPRLYERVGKPRPPVLGLGWTRLAMLYGLMGLAGFGVVQRSQPNSSVTFPIPAGYTKKQLENGFSQYSKTGSLVYIKPVRTAYSAEHSPAVCWRGSGYEFGKIEEELIGGHRVYSGTLQRGRERLYTAWWFTNGTCRTISQFDFRWRMLRGEPAFGLVNVTATRPDALTDAVQRWY
ncbi:exosortase N [Larkinella rosea]|uniref:Exosortase N n=1 Tax=Larkinella rosea TaxID=2025312 RepID=A0A3P1BUG2_9BACT|nr:exosortase N [Larkinella rosea]RRB04526.1 exosortase N [Larkinella rosea]